MDRLKSLRTVSRTAFTRTANAINVELAKPEPDEDILRVKLAKLEELIGKLKTSDEEIMTLLLEQAATEADIEAENEAASPYEERYQVLALKVDRIINPEDRRRSPTVSEASFETASESNRNQDRQPFKYPKIELKKFSGDIREWLGWWAQFKNIHESVHLKSSEKFQYLVQSMVKGSRAQQVVESYPQSDENYEKAVAALKSRFGKEDLITELYMRELVKLVICSANSSDKFCLSRFYDQLETKMQALESLGKLKKHHELLYPLVESSLPEETLRVWQRVYLSSKHDQRNDEESDRLSKLLEFLKLEVDNEERISLAKLGMGQSSEKKPKKKPESDLCVPTASGLVSTVTEPKSCVFCSKGHESKDCYSAQRMTLEQKKDKIRSSRACFYCFRRNHVAKSCKMNLKCQVCQKRHLILMCPELPANKSSTDSSDQDKKSAGMIGSSMTSQSGSLEVQLQTIMVNLIRLDGSKVRARIMLDTGCSNSAILRSTATKMNYIPTRTQTFTHGLYGGLETKSKIHNVYKVIIEGLDEKFRANFDVVEEDRICLSIPRAQRGPWMQELKSKKIWITDVGDDAPEIEVLIGSDVWGRLQTGRMVHLSNGLTATQTLFGWTISGKNSTTSGRSSQSLSTLVTSMVVTDASVAELWSLDALGITDPAEKKSKLELEEETKSHFQNTVARDNDGRYEVKLPWTASKYDLVTNRSVAEKRLQNCTKKLVSHDQLENYARIFQEWEHEGIIEEVPEEEHYLEKCHYLPHRPVFKPESNTTKVRPVYDASCKTGKNMSLNDCLAKGPNLLELIPDILLRFREKAIGVTADIRKAFLMISVAKDDRDYLRFLWWEQDQKRMKIYRHRRVVFGVSCSPFLLGAVIENHLSHVQLSEKEQADQLLRSMYVDNLVVSLSTDEEYEDFKEFSTRIMDSALMDLRVWERTAPEVSEISGCVPLRGLETGSKDEENACTSVLGLIWNRKEDHLKVKVNSIEVEGNITKRVILSTAHQVFDPMGFLCPATLEPKLLLRESCALKVGWDLELPGDIQKKFQNWVKNIGYLGDVAIRRRFCCNGRKEGKWSLHVFTDASKEAYATAVFLRSECEDRISVQLLQAKSRVAPSKQMTIPRLELLGCLIGCRLANCVIKALELDVPIFYWSDSTTALCWIKRVDNWGVFVNNRVKEIRKHSDPTAWHHVPGIMNPADLPSRGCSPKQLLESRWWEGPSWLKEPECEWPSSAYSVDESAVNAEKKRTIVMNVAVSESRWYLRRFSNYNQVVRLVAWMRRWSFKKSGSPGKEANLTVREINSAERKLWVIVQNESGLKEDSIPTIRLQREEDGLLVVMTKITRRDDDEDFLRPAFLLGNHPLTELLVRIVHEKNNHGGVQVVIALLREKVWVHGCRKIDKKVVGKCVTCRRFTAKKMDSDVAPLPEDRVKDARVFEVTGVDLGGPLFLKDGSKAWFVIFTCAVYRAIHLELVSSLSTESFLQAFRRFVARRSRPKIVYSDNGTNFRGFDNLMASLDWKVISASHGVDRIEWRFNPPTAAWWGGFWERMVGLVKGLLRRVLGKAVVSYEELNTILCDVESTINARPLTYVSEDSTDLIPLSPSLFLGDSPAFRVPGVDLGELTMLQRRFRYRVRLMSDLRQRFRKEYLGFLVQRKKEKKSSSISAGDIVLIGSDDRKRMDWPLGKVIEVFPGKDGVVRVVKLKTAVGELIRPVQRIYPLEVEAPTEDFGVKIVEESERDAGNVIVTRSGRTVKIPVRLGI